MCGGLLSEEVAKMVCVNVYDSTQVYVEEAYKGEAASSARLVVAGAGGLPLVRQLVGKSCSCSMMA